MRLRPWCLHQIPPRRHSTVCCSKEKKKKVGHARCTSRNVFDNDEEELQCWFDVKIRLPLSQTIMILHCILFFFDLQ